MENLTKPLMLTANTHYDFFISFFFFLLAEMRSHAGSGKSSAGAGADAGTGSQAQAQNMINRYRLNDSQTQIKCQKSIQKLELGCVAS